MSVLIMERRVQGCEDCGLLHEFDVKSKVWGREGKVELASFG